MSLSLDSCSAVWNLEVISPSWPFCSEICCLRLWISALRASFSSSLVVAASKASLSLVSRLVFVIVKSSISTSFSEIYCSKSEILSSLSITTYSKSWLSENRSLYLHFSSSLSSYSSSMASLHYATSVNAISVFYFYIAYYSIWSWSCYYSIWIWVSCSWSLA